MTRSYGSKAIPVELWPAPPNSPSKEARDCIIAMGKTSENVAGSYGVSWKDQGDSAAGSHSKASEAQKEGLFDTEIVPSDVENPPEQGLEDGQKLRHELETMAKDDCIRHNTKVESMAKLKHVFNPDGASTAGNSWQFLDGAAAVLMMRQSTATNLGRSSSVMGPWVSSHKLQAWLQMRWESVLPSLFSSSYPLPVLGQKTWAFGR